MTAPKSDPTPSLARDRVAQAYLGLWGGSYTQEKTRRRLHWLAGEAVGPGVLDIGCSEGMLAILMAREGYQVTALDVNEEALGYASELLANENDFVRERVELIHADVAAVSFKDNRFDTVILGEVIEHLVKPEEMLRRAVELLKEDGRLLLTTPFGHFPDPDHRQTFVLSDIVALLQPLCEPVSLAIEDGYIRFVGVNRTPSPEAWQMLRETQLLPLTERAAVDQQIFLRSHIESHKQEVERLKTQIEKVNGELSKVREEGATVGKSARELEKEVARREETAKQHAAQLAALQTRYDTLVEEMDKTQEIAVGLDKDLAAARSNSERLTRELGDARGREERLQSQLRDLRSGMEERERELGVTIERLKRELDALQSESAQRIQALERDRDRLREEAASLKAAIGEKESAIEAARRELTRERKRHEQEARQLDREYDQVSKRAYVAQLRTQELEETISYRFGIAVTRAVARPGLRSAKTLLAQLGEMWSTGRRMVKRVPDRTVLTLPIRVPGERTVDVDLTCPPAYDVRAEGATLHYKAPPDKGLMLISKETSRLTDAPLESRIVLKPNCSYRIRAKLQFSGARGRIHCIEYGTLGLLHGRDEPLTSGGWQMTWHTGVEHHCLCLGFELHGEGSLTIEGLSIVDESEEGVEGDGLLLDPRQPATTAIRLTRNPVQVVMPVDPRMVTILRGRMDIKDPKDRKMGYTLVRVMFLDDQGIEMSGPFDQIQESPAVGLYKYLRLPSEGCPEGEILRLRAPAGAAKVALGFQTWRAQGGVTLGNRLDVVSKTVWSFPSFDKPEPDPEGRPLVASILDTFSEACFRYELNLLPLTKENWRAELEPSRPAMLLAESAWQGNDGNWRGVMTNYAKHPDNPLRELLAHCRRIGLKTVFWNKEDPPNYDQFIDVARDFDIIFTTAEECIPRYREDCGHDRVYCMPFAAQPAIHNPIGKQESDNFDVAFAGTWYKRKHHERSALLPHVLDPATQYRLFIFDRMSDWYLDDSYQFPEPYEPFLHPKVSYDEMLNLHRVFKVFLNTNSVLDSPTMFSRRIFEILASATPVVSTASVGVEQMFAGLVPVVHDKQQAAEALDRLLDDPWHRKQIGHRGYRRVMTEHTLEHRVRDMFQRIGLDGLSVQDVCPKVTLAVPTNRPDNLKYIEENYSRQNYPNRELIIVLNNDAFNREEVEQRFAPLPNVKVLQLPEDRTLGECLNLSIDHATGDYWSKLDDDNLYCEDFMSDLMLPYKYCNAEIVGKGTYFIYLEGLDVLALRFPDNEHRFVKFLSGSAMVIRRDVFEKVRFPEVSVGEDTQLMKDCLAMGMQMYSTDAFNYVVMRRADLTQHTWKINEEELLKTSRKVSDGLQLDYVRA